MRQQRLAHVSRLPSAAEFTGQRGVALLTILLMVAMATILASSLLMKQQRLIREASVLFRQDQATQYALAGERFLMELLAADQQSGANTDHLGELWAQPTPPYPVEDGFVSGRLIEQSGRFNVNNLYHDGQPDAQAVAMFGRLLTQVGLSADLADAVLDWQDPDDQITGAAGAEDSFYQGQQPSYRAANRPLLSVQELRLVRGFESAEAFELIEPYVSAVPAFAPINLNTAQAPLLAAVVEGMDRSSIGQWVSRRDQSAQPVEQVAAFWDTAGQAQITPELRTQAQRFLAVSSTYYQGQVTVLLSGRTRYLTSDFYRKGAKIYPYQRSFAPIVELGAESNSASTTTQ